jgi:hypothetical protein
MAANKVGDDRLGQQTENRRIAEEAGDVDQQILGQQIEFVRVRAQHREIAVDAVGLYMCQRHATLDPALERAGFVEAEIMHRPGAQKLDDDG